jgi:hypothetical protein
MLAAMMVTQISATAQTRKSAALTDTVSMRKNKGMGGDLTGKVGIREAQTFRRLDDASDTSTERGYQPPRMPRFLAVLTRYPCSSPARRPASP